MGRYQTVVRQLADCARMVQAAVAEAPWRSAADVIGIGADGDATTVIDMVAEKVALDFLANMVPAVNVFSEETGWIDHGSSMTIIVDPIDATNNALAIPNFVEERSTAAPTAGRNVLGFPYFAFSCGIVDAGELVAGVVMNLATGEMFTTERGHGVRLDAELVQPRPVTELRQARVALIRPETPAAWRLFQQLSDSVMRIRLTGCSALDLALITSGTLDALVNPNRISPGGHGEKVVDYAGALAMLDETGGLLTDHDGVPLTTDLDLTRRTPLVGACNAHLHARILEVLAAETWADSGGGAA